MYCQIKKNHWGFITNIEKMKLNQFRFSYRKCIVIKFLFRANNEVIF
jgi:hypothetical protein